MILAQRCGLLSFEATCAVDNDTARHIETYANFEATFTMDKMHVMNNEEFYNFEAAHTADKQNTKTP